MKTETKPSISIGLKGRGDYGQMPLLQLEDWIAHNSDRQALKELHNNRWLNSRDCNRKYRLAEYIEMKMNSSIARKWCGNDSMTLVEAYNRTIDKFNNMPVQTDDDQSKPQGPDCRLYFLACFIYTTNLFKEKPPANALEAEMISREALQRMADRQIHFSCLEERRKGNPFVRRYRLERDHGDLYLSVPWLSHSQ